MASYTYSPTRHELELAAESYQPAGPPPLVQQHLTGWVSPMHSPFIPNIAFGTPSPMAQSIPLPPSPYTPSSPYTSPSHALHDYPPIGPPQRQRTVSFNTAQLAYSPFQTPPSPQFLQVQTPGHHRRRSYGGSTSSTPASPFRGNAPLPTFGAEQIQLNPWLVPRGDIVLDFSSPDFRVDVMMSAATRQLIPLTDASFLELATSSAITKMRIVCDLLPQLPIDVSSDRGPNGILVPLTVGNILTHIWKMLHSRISMKDWQTIGMENETRATRAYMARCKSLGPLEVAERQQGVKWVDMLCGRVWFKGLVRENDVYKLLVA